MINLTFHRNISTSVTKKVIDQSFFDTLALYNHYVELCFITLLIQNICTDMYLNWDYENAQQEKCTTKNLVFRNDWYENSILLVAIKKIHFISEIALSEEHAQNTIDLYVLDALAFINGEFTT